MTDRLYYENSFLHDFVAALMAVRRLPDGCPALIFDRTAFYPTSGGQTFDTGWIEWEDLDHPQALRPKFRVTEVLEDEATGEILHLIESLPELERVLAGTTATPSGEPGSSAAIGAGPVPPGNAVRVRGYIDVERRRDHLQQHSGQHVLSAAFVELLELPTVSFHMGEESCTIDLDAKSLSPEQLLRVEQRANQIVFEDRAVKTHFVTPEEAREMGLRKVPPAGRERLRIIDIADFDLCACGGTHVRATGQVGAILLRKVEKVKQGVRVEFVCGDRAVRVARKDYETLAEAAGLYSTQLWTVPEQVRKSLEEIRAATKFEHKLLEEVAELTAAKMLAESELIGGIRLIARVLEGREIAFAKMLAHKLVTEPQTVALLGCGTDQPALVFAQWRGGPFDMGALMKQEMARLGSRGGGSRELAQGGVPGPEHLEGAIERAKAAILSPSSNATAAPASQPS
jgi:alanyl-tRNA synthetase